MRKHVTGSIDTGIPLISTLITGINKGDTKIPQFQRKFVWKEEQAIDLLDSIANNYPVGSLLLWKTKEKLRAERNIGEFRLPSTDEMDPTDYVLDGQQRLTVIYSCLGAKEGDEGFAVVYDLEDEVFLRLPENPKVHQFPLRRMFSTTKLLNFRTALQSQAKSDDYQERLDSIIKAFQDYRLPVVTLRDLSVEEVCPIFERINSSGTKLSTYDLMVAATWNKDFDLNEEVDEIREALRPKGFEDIDRTTVLKVLSAVKLGTIQEISLKTLRDINREEMKSLIKATQAAMLKTVDLLSTEFNIYSWEFLAYEALVIILCYIFTQTDSLNSIQVHRVCRWFWRSSLSERYKVGGANFVSRDLKIVYDFVVDGIGTPDSFGRSPSEKDWMSILFRSNVSRSRAYILALAAKHPYNLTNGLRIDSAVALSSFNKKQFHHVYPRAHLRRIEREYDDNLVVNICMLSAEGNNSVSDSDPRLYLPACAIALKARADEVFSSNILPTPSSFDYSKASYDEFIRERVKLVTSFIRTLCDGSEHDAPLVELASPDTK